MESLDLRIDGVSKSFGPVRALEAVDLHVPAGSLATLLGASGCGKTTLLRILAGFESADTGTVGFGGRDMAGVPVWKRRIGFVFQAYALWPHLTVFENVAYGLRLRKLPKPEIAAKVEQGLAMVGLTGREDRRPGQLSGGQQQRVALARALALDPDVLLMDEPLSNLDAKLRVEMRREIRRIQRRTGITAVYVTHDQEEALEISDVIAVMNEGRIEQAGTPEEIYAEPRTAFVASFVGSVSLLDGPAFGLAEGVTVAVRPEDLELGGGQFKGTAFEGTVFKGTVVESSYQGGRRSSVAELSGGRRLLFEHREPIATGETVTLTARRHTVVS
ncbi:ABC transporter ATP-binding protein [Nonomuraea sp. NBC_01738]|uniref:ABC transporter ATP-binding protein n=1 Tax=Nonomuraea sp. NBC_01738 TaxID=2976003 RepID=UPI002E13BA4D|nr:ABC transporter ATP-binding protein [Nonomuraea sp. NBC_01738]